MRANTPLSNENGAVLIVTVVVLVALTAIGLTLNTVSNLETKMTTNEKCKEIARYNGESCSISTAKLIKMILQRSAKTGVAHIYEGDYLAQGITYPEATGAMSKEQEFAYKVMGMTGDTVCEDCFVNLPGPPDENRAGADIIPAGPETTEGTAGNVHIGGYDHGIGLGAAGGGGTSLWFVVACRGDGCNQNAHHLAFSRYRKVLGLEAGGM